MTRAHAHPPSQTADRVPVTTPRLRALAPLFALVVACAFPASAFAQRGPGGFMGSPDRPAGELIERHAEELELDDESLAAINEIIASSRARGEELDFQLQEAHRRLHFLLARDLPVEAEVMEHAEIIGRIRTEESKHRLGVLLKIRAHLSAEQLEKLHGIRQEAAREGPLGQLMEVCRADVESLCSDAPRGRETMMCMREHRDALSAECSAAVESTRSRARDRGWSPRGLR